ncbi:hypothetical protein [Clostridium perfringens]|uniref:hypothetical protein n=1 Tax=Clostridium perfringens TaxID=1502 RepID=UPI0032DAA95F
MKDKPNYECAGNTYKAVRKELPTKNCIQFYMNIITSKRRNFKPFVYGNTCMKGFFN